MKKVSLFLLLILYLVSFQLNAQVIYYDADQFPLIGKTSDKTETRYERLPSYLKDCCRPALWNLGKNTSGLAIRFRTNSTSIFAKWEVTQNNQMNHMTDTGIKGVDLYAWEKDHWQPMKAGLPKGKTNEQIIISNMTSKEREYIMFLPLYDGIISLSIGIDSTATIKKPELPYPNTTHPILVYGTSITQGGCASRPGMSYTNILVRELNREVINLGFSGNGQLDYEIAELMATRKDPNTPILFIETIIFPHSFYDLKTYETITEKNRLLREEYEKIKREGDKNVYYLTSDNLIGNDGEATVDGIHLTDVGFVRIAEKLFEAINKIENN